MKKIIVYAALGALILFSPVFLFAGGKKEKTDRGDAAAIVNGDVITKAEYNKEMDLFKSQFGAQSQVLTDEQLSEFSGELLENLVQRKLLDQEIAKAKIKVDSTWVDKELSNIKGQFPSTEEYNTALTAQGFTEQTLKEQITKTKARETFFDEKFRKTIVISDDDAKLYYTANPDLFTQPEQVRASHILVTVQPGAAEDVKNHALAKIKSVETKAKAGGDFAALAGEFSDCPSKAQGGDLDFFSYGEMVPQFEDAAFGLEVGEISGIVETQFGYHIIKLTDKRPPQTVDFEMVKADLKDYLSQEKVVTAVNEYLAELRKSAKVEILIQ